MATVETRFFLLQSKFPQVFIPFLQALREVGPEAYHVLSDMHTYMQTLPRGFREFDVLPDDPNDIILLGDLCLYAPRDEASGIGGIFIGKGSRGRIIPVESNNFTVQWQFDYDGWGFLGRVLEHTAAVSPTDVVAQEILLLISDMLEQLEGQDALTLLDSVSQLLDRDTSIIAIVGHIFEEASARKNIGVSVAALKFFTALIRHRSADVWAFLVNSSLSDPSGNGGRSAFILSSVEIINGDYRFTLAVITFVSNLVTDALFSKLAPHADSVQRSEILLGLIRHLVNVFESFSYWKYQFLVDRLDIATYIAEIFINVLTLVYSVDEMTDGPQKLNGILYPASSVIIDRFLSDGKSVRCLQPLLSAINAASKSLNSLATEQELLDRTYEWVECAIRFLEQLVRTRSLLPNRPPSRLERQLFISSPKLVALFQKESVFRQRIMTVFNAVVSSTWTTEDQPSLLAHLGSKCAVDFANALADALNSDIDLMMQNEIAKFATLVFRAKQQGLAILFLTGQEGGKLDQLESNRDNKNVPLVDTLRSKLYALDRLPAEFAANLLESLTFAQNTLSTSILEDEDNKLHRFVDKLLTIIDRGSSGRITGLESSETIVRFSYEALVAARAVQLCAVHLWKSGPGSKGCGELIRHFEGKIVELSSVAFKTQGYRASLHGNLHRNFERKWPEISLIRFQRTDLVASERKYGVQYKYDVAMMNWMLRADPIWDGYRLEVEQSNLNLSLVDAQSHLFWGWWILSVALMEYVADNHKLAKSLEEVAQQCLTISVQEGVLAPLILPLVNGRSNLAFMITMRLQELSSETSKCKLKGYKVDYQSLLRLSSSLINSVDLDFAQALSTSSHSNYRPLLRLLIVCLRGVQSTTMIKSNSETAKTVQDLLQQVVSRSYMIFGPEVLAAFHPLQEDDEGHCMTEQEQDMLLITTILRECLNTGGIT
ncbi:nucleoporin subcomplex protein binding to Pom34-domain-containing protein [Lipomyces oligophaga]|uniref:nucleoporin subcomplex protein binding to Pom34-domain-containing protein n=1 Tax=Lipomyces oligophaga TaxID=45792 RepID=UPI0034CF3996